MTKKRFFPTGAKVRILEACKSLLLPDQTFHNLRASISINIFFQSTSIDGFNGSLKVCEIFGRVVLTPPTKH